MKELERLQPRYLAHLSVSCCVLSEHPASLPSASEQGKTHGSSCSRTQEPSVVRLHANLSLKGVGQNRTCFPAQARLFLLRLQAMDWTKEEIDHLKKLSADDPGISFKTLRHKYYDTGASGLKHYKEYSFNKMARTLGHIGRPRRRLWRPDDIDCFSRLRATYRSDEEFLRHFNEEVPSRHQMNMRELQKLQGDIPTSTAAFDQQDGDGESDLGVDHCSHPRTTSPHRVSQVPSKGRYSLRDPQTVALAASKSQSPKSVAVLDQQKAPRASSGSLNRGGHEMSVSITSSKVQESRAKNSVSESGYEEARGLSSQHRAVQSKERQSQEPKSCPPSTPIRNNRKPDQGIELPFRLSPQGKDSSVAGMSDRTQAGFKRYEQSTNNLRQQRQPSETSEDRRSDQARGSCEWLSISRRPGSSIADSYKQHLETLEHEPSHVRPLTAHTSASSTANRRPSSTQGYTGSYGQYLLSSDLKPSPSSIFALRFEGVNPDEGTRLDPLEAPLSPPYYRIPHNSSRPYLPYPSSSYHSYDFGEGGFDPEQGEPQDTSRRYPPIPGPKTEGEGEGEGFPTAHRFTEPSLRRDEKRGMAPFESEPSASPDTPPRRRPATSEVLRTPTRGPRKPDKRLPNFSPQDHKAKHRKG